MRQPADVFPRSVEVVAVSDLTRPVEWRALLKEVSAVVHLAGIAHASVDIAEAAYDRVNRLATAELAAAAHAAAIQRLVFVSSIRAQSGPASR
jgi:nucleoside-diphosphate-sugar epimerase